jgi:biotin carboxyl carrier protein
MMNQIASDVNGMIERILVQNGDPVEYDQVLFLINPD